MKDLKDIFSDQAALYAVYRPQNPDALYQYLFKTVNDFNAAWDCGTGNGQVAVRLAEKFNTVYATDISQKQLDNAVKRDNIQYSNQRAEHTNIPSGSIDLITVAQAIHWFDFDLFYKEVYRVAKSDAYIFISTYNLLKINAPIDHIINTLYLDILNGYWDPERKYIDEEYKTIPFPFREIKAPKFEIKLNWGHDQLIGYLNTWSATQHYIKKNNTNPITLITDKLEDNWPEGEIKEITFPLHTRFGQINK